MTLFQARLAHLRAAQEALLARRNALDPKWYNGLFERYCNPVVTAAHIPLDWRYDVNPQTNPYLIERLGVNAVFNAGTIELAGKILIVCRVEGTDRKSFFAVAESATGLDGFRFWEEPIDLPETADPDVNVYDMRLTQHEDGWIYGVFCTERRDPDAPPGDLSSVVVRAGLARTKDLKAWTRLPDLQTRSQQQRAGVLHPELVNGRYAFYIRPHDDFIQTGKGGGIGWGLAWSLHPALIEEELIIEPLAYHTIKEANNGEGPAPLKTERGWLHLAHGVRETAAGLRSVLYLYLSDVQHPWVVTHRPGGYFLALQGGERVGDVSNVAFSNGWVQRADGTVLIYYASSDTRLHVATSSIDRLLDYVVNTPEDGLRSAASVQQRLELIRRNRALDVSDPS